MPYVDEPVKLLSKRLSGMAETTPALGLRRYLSGNASQENGSECVERGAYYAEGVGELQPRVSYPGTKVAK
jgi:hypothetical protein